MKGIILAGGNGRRLTPLTDVTNKHLLPVYDRPMILYPLHTLVNAGIKEILIVTGKEYAGGFIKLLGSGREFGCRLTFEVQEDALGIAHALSLAEDFVDGQPCAVILGDNIFEDSFALPIQNFKSGGEIFLKEVEDAYRFGVANIFDGVLTSIEEKPRNIRKGLAVTGMYLYDTSAFAFIKTLTPSARGELEITDVNNYFINKGEMKFTQIAGQWTDSGTFESLYRANTIARELAMTGKPSPFETVMRAREHRYVTNPAPQKSEAKLLDLI